MILRFLRHLIITPLFCALVLVVVLLTPALLVLSGLLALLVDRRQWRPPRGVVMAVTYAVHDVLAVFAGLALWLRLGGGGVMNGEAMQRRHYRLIHWLLRRIADTAERVLALRVEVDGSPEAEAALTGMERPVIVLSRHDGPGDSLLVARELLRRGRRPRIVLRAALQLDPCFDILGNRLPFYFIPGSHPDGEETTGRIAALSAGMSSMDALLLFPEGGNVTQKRRLGAIRHLRQEGLQKEADQAAAMQHVVAPRPGGVLAAVAANPAADVVIVTHSGLAGMSATLWRRVPADITLLVHLWLVPASTIPAEEEARLQWLFGWWKRVDEWVAANAAEVARAPQYAAGGR